MEAAAHLPLLLLLLLLLPLSPPPADARAPPLRIQPLPTAALRRLYDTSNYGKLQLNNGLALTPQMGWNSWNFFACNINETLIRDTADALVSTGLAELGYNYVNIDDCWSYVKRGNKDQLLPDPKSFPSGIKALADYVHGKGLKLGIYSDAGKFTCQVRPGSLYHENDDAALFASWILTQRAMDLPVADLGTERGEGPLLQCPYCDSEAMHKLAQLLLPGLAAVCVDGTTGDLFRKPSVVAVELRKEMVDYITQRSDTFIADALIESEANQETENEMPEDPFEIVSIFMDDFSSTKRNIIGHVSGWLLSDSREDKIDDFVQEMEMTRFWPLDRREAIAEVLLKNVDLKTKFHCPEKYENEERLADHKEQCSFRPVSCPNDGCRAKVSVRCMQGHDAACPFKVLQCEQNCEKRLLRRDMDRHCVTVCSMRPMKCPFGCDSSFPERDLEKHCLEFLQAHLLKVLKVIHKKGRAEEELKELAQKLEKYDEHGKLAKARDARPLTNVVKDLEAKMKGEPSS